MASRPSRSSERYRRWYLSSRQWRRRRAAWFKRNGGYCRACGYTGRLDLHHKTYERLGHEYDRDLVALCRFHHRQAHIAYDSGKYRSRAAATKVVIDRAKTKARLTESILRSLLRVIWG
jgi:5-methylcytosine-specific restriction endonuclease McrA